MDLNEKLTLGELEVGDMFIVFPGPGDNAGHGGFKGSMRILEKIAARDPKPHHTYGDNMCDLRGVESHCPDSIEVIKLALAAEQKLALVAATPRYSSIPA